MFEPTMIPGLVLIILFSFQCGNIYLTAKCWPQSRDFHKIFGETETMKMATRRDQNFGEPEEERFILHSPGE